MEYNNLGIQITYNEKGKKIYMDDGNNKLTLGLEQLVGCIVIFRDIAEKIKSEKLE